MIIKLTEEDEVIEFSKISLDNSIIRVQEGPLYELENIISKIDKRKGRAKVLIPFMGTPKFFDLGVEILGNK